MPEVVAQSVPPTVAQPPRMLLVVPVVVAMPLVELLMAFEGFVKFTVEPIFRVISPTESRSVLPPLLVSEMEEAAGLSVRPANVWAEAPPRPVTWRMPPPMTSVPAVPRMLLAGALALLKSSRNVPAFTVVAPV